MPPNAPSSTNHRSHSIHSPSHSQWPITRWKTLYPLPTQPDVADEKSAQPAIQAITELLQRYNQLSQQITIIEHNLLRPSPNEKRYGINLLDQNSDIWAFLPIQLFPHRPPANFPSGQRNNQLDNHNFRKNHHLGHLLPASLCFHTTTHIRTRHHTHSYCLHSPTGQNNDRHHR